MKRAPLAALLLAAVLIGGGIWFYFNFERVTDREYVGLQGEARRNQLLAATRLIERMGMRTRQVRHFADLDRLAPRGTLILARHRAALTQAHVDRLLSWVEQGGLLIVEAEHYQSRDLVLDALKLRRRALRLRAPPAPAEIRLPDAPAPLRVRFDFRQDLVDAERRAAATVHDHWSALLLEYRHGRGRIAVLNGFSFLYNLNIGRNDHAEFAWRLVQWNPAAPEVVVATWLATPSLVAWLHDNAWQALATAAALLGLWLWSVMPRFGPLRPDPLPQRRRLLDHLRASGLFHWKAGGAARLTAAAREACLRNIARIHPGVAELPPAERVARFAALTRLPARDLDLALGEAARDPGQFTAAIRTLQAMDERLTRKTT